MLCLVDELPARGSFRGPFGDSNLILVKHLVISSYANVIAISSPATPFAQWNSSDVPGRHGLWNNALRRRYPRHFVMARTAWGDVYWECFMGMSTGNVYCSGKLRLNDWTKKAIGIELTMSSGYFSCQIMGYCITKDMRCVVGIWF